MKENALSAAETAVAILRYVVFWGRYQWGCARVRLNRLIGKH